MENKCFPSLIWRWAIWLIAPSLLFLPLAGISRLQLLGNSDALFYSSILAMTFDALKSGIILPQWFAQANAGFGSPVMMYYAPLAYIITAALTLPLPHLDTGTRLLIGIYISQIASGYTAFLWLRRSFTEHVAFIGSLLFVLLPYKFIYLYIHINLAQLWALVWLPLWMIAAEDMVKRSRRAIGLYALFMACVYYTHPLTLIAFGAVPACYVLWFGKQNFLKNSTYLAVANILGILLCLMQLIPEHSYINWIHSEQFLEGKYVWYNNFYHVDVVLCAYYGMIALLVGFAIRRIPAIAAHAISRVGVFWIIVLGVVLFLTQSISAWLWKIVTPLQYLQFPAARLHSVALMGVTYLICIWLGYYQEMLALGTIVYRRVVLVLIVIFFLMMTAQRIYEVETNPKGASPSYIGDALDQRIIPAMPISVYETRWGCINAADAYTLYEHKKIPESVAVLSGKAIVSQVEWSPPERIAFTANVISQDATLTIRQCYIPLWQGKDHALQDIPLFPEKNSGLIEISLPPGSHSMEISLKPSLVQRISRWISLAALCVTLSLLIAQERLYRRNSP